MEGASKTVSSSHSFEKGVLQIQIALSTTGGLVGGWEYKLSGSTPHNGITQHNTNKARVQASSLLTQRRADSNLSVSLSLDSFLLCCHFFSLPFALSFPRWAVTQTCRYQLSRSLPRIPSLILTKM